MMAALGSLLFGFDASVISGVIPYLSDAFQISNAEIGLVVGAPTLAGTLSGLLAGPLSDRVGRKPVLTALAALYTVSAIASAVAPDVATLVFARFVGGLGFASIGIAPLYIGEIAPPAVRGRMVTWSQLNIVVGFSAAYFSNYLIALSAPEAPWRWMLGLEIVPAIGWWLSLGAIPRSPRWLVLAGHPDRARHVLASLGYGPEVEAVLADVQASVAHGLLPLGRQLRALAEPAVRRPLFLAIGLAVAQQVCGINAVYFYAPTLFEHAGAGLDAALLQAVVLGVLNVGITVVAMMGVDRVGRRPLLLTGMAGIVISALGIALSFAWGTPTGVFLCVIGFVLSFGISLGPVMWVLMAELFANRVRGVATAVAGLFNGAASFGVQFLFPLELAWWGPSPTFAVYAALTALSLVLLWRMLPETKGQSLEALERQFAASHPPVRRTT